MLCVVVLEVEDGDFSDLKGSALDVHSSVISVLLHSSERATPNPSNRQNHRLQCQERQHTTFKEKNTFILMLNENIYGRWQDQDRIGLDRTGTDRIDKTRTGSITKSPPKVDGHQKTC